MFACQQISNADFLLLLVFMFSHTVCIANLLMKKLKSALLICWWYVFTDMLKKKKLKSTMLISEYCVFVSKLAMRTCCYYYYYWYLCFRLWAASLICWWHTFAGMLTKQKTNKLVKPTLLICWIPSTSSRPTRNETKRDRTKWSETNRFPGWAHSPNLSFNMDVGISMYFCV